MPLTTYTPGQVLDAASLNANLVFAAATGVTLVSATTIGTTVSSVTVSSAFSSTYDNYLIMVAGGVASVSTSIRMTLGATATGYYSGGIYNTFASATVTAQSQSNAAFWSVGSGTANSLSSNIILFSPNLAKATLFDASNVAVLTNGDTTRIGGFLDNTTSYTAFTLTATSGTFTGGTIYVYGYAKV